MENDSVGSNFIAQRYKVINTLSGGMGSVHFCLDIEQDNSPVALKTFKPEFLADRNARERFLREATIWVDLEYHPNIVQAYKVLHLAEDQSVYIIMQLIPTPPGFADPSLRTQQIAQSPFTVERSLAITLGIIRGMEYATSKIPSLVHRDLKPDNILIGTDGQPKITDFGLAGVRPNALESKSHISFSPYQRMITQAGGMGTPLYMSPEQWVRQEVDLRSDIYAVGCILYEMLTGQFAVYGNNSEELFKAHSSGIGLININRSNLKPSLKILLQKCLNPKYQERFAKWEDFEGEVKRIFADEGYKLKYSDETPLDVSLMSQYQKAESLLAIGAAYINIGNFVDGQGYFEKAQEIAEQHRFSVLLALAIANQGLAFSNQGYFEKAIAQFKEAIPIFQQLGEKGQVCYHTGNIGNAYFGLHDYNNAKQYLENAFHLAEQLHDPLNQALWMGNLGNVYQAKGDYRKALDIFQAAFEISKTTKDRSSVSKHLASIASVYEALRDFQKSFEYYQSALKETEQIGDRQTEGLLYLSIGGLLTKQKKVDEGIKYLTLALNIGKEIHDLNLTAKALGNVATAYLLKNQVKPAIPLLEEAIKLSKEINADDIYARAHWSLGLIAEAQGNFRDAIAHLRSAVLTFKELNMPEYQQASNHLVELRKKLGLL